MGLLRTRGHWVYVDEKERQDPDICHLRQEELDRIIDLNYDIFVSVLTIRTYIDGEVI